MLALQVADCHQQHVAMAILDGLVVDSAQVVSSQEVLQDEQVNTQVQMFSNTEQLICVCSHLQVLTCSWPAAVSILCLACRVEDDDIDTDILCLSHRTSSHIQDSCRDRE